MTHLWEVEHPYYCNEGNYYAGKDQPHTEYKSFGEFIHEEGDNDKDMNLVFRWDWHEEGDDGECNFNGDINYRNGRLLLFYMGQRKGLYRWVEVQVCRADEPAIIEFLKPLWAHLKELWEPLSGAEENRT